MGGMDIGSSAGWPAGLAYAVRRIPLASDAPSLWEDHGDRAGRLPQGGFSIMFVHNIARVVAVLFARPRIARHA